MDYKIGDVFERLTVEAIYSEKLRDKAKFRCSCGAIKAIRFRDVVCGKTTSCGCIRRKHIVSTGQVFGRLTIINDGIIKFGKTSKVLCRCICGVEKLISTVKMSTGITSSCGCLVKERMSKATLTHGDHGGPIYRVWRGIKTRCENKNSKDFKRYGGRGIKVCQQWSESYEIFKGWALGNSYSDGLEIDRINNDGDYEPGNCRFVNSLRNQNNKSTNVLLTAFGETKSMSDWHRDQRCVVSYQTLTKRIKSGLFSHESAITKVSTNVRHSRKTI